MCSILGDLAELESAVEKSCSFSHCLLKFSFVMTEENLGPLLSIPVCGEIKSAVHKENLWLYIRDVSKCDYAIRQSENNAMETRYFSHLK